ncbi:hypothetical protein [Mesorhizobium sp. WSM4982]|uniref:hypothetical protein n=1 Tax=Mesorhizobium sp. WSM4982 TaxID=3038550 RepID=UPI002414E105|nr:hypothetical protein [Mesorhizobium sp. WSM4982]MDG4856428.1 hypothetical protein [Mesorhizobium sp. WSM4982]
MSTVRITNLTGPWLRDFLSHPIRPEDLAEWQDAGLDPQADLPDMLDKAIDVRCAVDDSKGIPECVAIWAVSVSEGIGTLMLIGSDRPELVVTIHQEFSRDEWHRIKLLAPVLQCYPSVKNKTHLKWVEHFGFKAEGKPLVIGKGKYQRYVFTAE